MSLRRDISVINIDIIIVKPLKHSLLRQVVTTINLLSAVILIDSGDTSITPFRKPEASSDTKEDSVQLYIFNVDVNFTVNRTPDNCPFCGLQRQTDDLIRHV